MDHNKESLEKLLNHYDNLYYNKDLPEITDHEYDQLKKKYVELYGEYNYVPGKANVNSIKYKHTTNVSSLDKVQISDINRLTEEIERLWPIVIQPKMDGLTLVSYPDGNFVTRGNGEIGEVVTDKILSGVSGIGNNINHPVRSEVVMLKQYLDSINKKRIEEDKEPFKNLRNAAAGMLRNKDITKVEGLKSFAYNIIKTTEFNNCNDQIKELQNNNWNTVDTYIPNTKEEALKYITEYNEMIRPNLDYEIDGLVIKHNGEKLFGETSHHPKNAIAVKFEGEGAWTRLTDIVWQVGRTGKIVPVAEFESIHILGSDITRATLHNIGIMNNIGLDKLSINSNKDLMTEVYVIKANDVIPAIIETKQPNCLEGITLNKITEPMSCPECNGEIEKINFQLYCTNNNCPAKLQGQIELLASREALNIEGLSDMTIEKMINYAKENNIDINFTLPFYFSYDDILKLEGFAETSAKKLYDNIQNAKDTELKRFIYSASIPLIGKRASEDIANTILNVEALGLEINEFETISKIPEFGPKMISSLKTYAQERFYLLWEAGIRPKPVNKKIIKVSEQLTFVITGSFDIPRKKIEEKIKESGHKVSGSVSKKTSYLLASKGEESTSKYKKAKDLNVKIINTLEELNELI